MGHSRNYSEAIAYSIDKEVKRLMDECHAKAHDLLNQYRKELDIIAKALTEKENLNNFEFNGLLEGRSLEELEEAQEARREELERKKSCNAKGLSIIGRRKKRKRAQKGRPIKPSLMIKAVNPSSYSATAFLCGGFFMRQRLSGLTKSQNL